MTECVGDGSRPSASGCAASAAAGRASGAAAGAPSTATGAPPARAMAAAGAGPASAANPASSALPAGMGGNAGQLVAAGSGAAAGSSATPVAVGGHAGSAGSAGVGALAGSAGTDALDCGPGGMVGQASNAPGARQGSGAGKVYVQFSASNQIKRLRTTMDVPARPNGNSTLFLWPGVEPIQGSPHYSPIGTGVLQPVLTWGGSCAPGYSQQRQANTWWISGQYVNTLGNQRGFMGCYGGDIMNVAIGDKLLIDMRLDGSVWKQTITDMNTGKSVDFDEDLQQQEQRWAMFVIETPTSTRPSADVVFTDTLIELTKPEPKSCQPSTRGANDYFSAPVSSSDGLRCCISRLVLRAQGVAATSMDPAP